MKGLATLTRLVSLVLDHRQLTILILCPLIKHVNGQLQRTRLNQHNVYHHNLMHLITKHSNEYICHAPSTPKFEVKFLIIKPLRLCFHHCPRTRQSVTQVQRSNYYARKVKIEIQKCNP